MSKEAAPPRVEIEVPDEIRAHWNEMGGPIVKYPEQVLRQRAEPLTKPDASTRTLVEKMKVAMAEYRGVGLAAPQLGVSQRVIIYQVPEEKSPLRVVVNPRIISAKGEQVGPEGCLSMPTLQGDVNRANEVVVKGMDILGRPFKRRATEFEARILQHEIDHLDGILFIDRADLETLHWLTAEEDTGEVPEE
jgi:peptide deformylase